MVKIISRNPVCSWGAPGSSRLYPVGNRAIVGHLKSHRWSLDAFWPSRVTSSYPPFSSILRAYIVLLPSYLYLGVEAGPCVTGLTATTCCLLGHLPPGPPSFHEASQRPGGRHLTRCPGGDGEPPAPCSATTQGRGTPAGEAKATGLRPQRWGPACGAIRAPQTRPLSLHRDVLHSHSK